MTATFQLAHVDRAPLGDLETTVLVLLASHPDVEVEWTHRRGARDYSLATSDLRAALDGAPLASPGGHRAGAGARSDAAKRFWQPLRRRLSPGRTTDD